MGHTRQNALAEGELKEFPWVNCDPLSWNSVERNHKPTPAPESDQNSPKGRSIVRRKRKRKNQRFLPQYRYELLDLKGHIDVIPRISSQSAVQVSIALPALLNSIVTSPTRQCPEEYLIIAGYSRVSFPLLDFDLSEGSPNRLANFTIVAPPSASVLMSTAVGVVCSVYRHDK